MKEPVPLVGGPYRLHLTMHRRLRNSPERIYLGIGQKGSSLKAGGEFRKKELADEGHKERLLNNNRGCKRQYSESVNTHSLTRQVYSS